ncbi:MAG: stability/partitioning determinant [Caulobacteraceae bacterium]
MNTRERAKLFDESPLLEAAASFKPKDRSQTLTPNDIGNTRAIAEAHGFTSREPVAAPVHPDPMMRVVKVRKRSPYTEQFGIRATPDSAKRFYDMVNDNDWSLGEAFERAVDALEKSLKGRAG